MVYAVSSIGKEKHSDHISVLKKETDKFQYEDMVFPADYNSIEAFEDRNKVCVLICEIDAERTAWARLDTSNIWTTTSYTVLRIDSEEE